MTDNKDALKVALVDAVISAYTSTRLSHVPAVDHVLSSPLVRQSLAALTTPPQDAMREALHRSLLAADNLFALLEAHQDQVGESLEPEDQAIVHGAKDDMAFARAALSAPNVAGQWETLQSVRTADPYDDCLGVHALSTPQPESAQAALAEAIEALRPFAKAAAGASANHVTQFVYVKDLHRAAQVVAKHGEGR